MAQPVYRLLLEKKKEQYRFFSRQIPADCWASHSIQIAQLLHDRLPLRVKEITSGTKRYWADGLCCIIRWCPVIGPIAGTEGHPGDIFFANLRDRHVAGPNPVHFAASADEAAGGGVGRTAAAAGRCQWHALRRQELPGAVAVAFGGGAAGAVPGRCETEHPRWWEPLHCVSWSSGQPVWQRWQKLIEQSWCEPVGIWSWDATFELAGCEFEQSLLYLGSNKNTHISYTHGLYMRICHGCFKIILPFPEITKVFLRSQSMPDLLGSSWYDMQFFSVVGSSGMETGRNSCLWRTWLLQLSGFRVGAVFNDFEFHAKMLLKFHKSSRESPGVSGTHTEQGKTSLNLSACLFGVDDAHWFCVQIEYFPVAS